MKSIKYLAEAVILTGLLAGGCMSDKEKKFFELNERRKEMFNSKISLPEFIYSSDLISDRFKKNQRDVYVGIIFYGRYNFDPNSSDRLFVNPQEARELLRICGWENIGEVGYKN